MRAMISGIMTKETDMPDPRELTHCGDGPGAELERIYDRYGRGMLNFARALLGSADDAEDAVQEIFVRLARNAARVHRIKDLRNYLFRATRNEVYELLRSRMRCERLEDGVARHLQESPPEAPSPEVVSILESFSKLPSEQREVVALKLFEGLTFREIGKIIGRSQNTVASRYRYAIERLRQAAGSDEDGY
jgi:RNA polymerase sigma-70 factor, ECF subfamily